ncbi:MAG: YfhO family protein [Clostridia bacterium]|nr:YfhO family protein [Clostridia bacterium]
MLFSKEKVSVLGKQKEKAAFTFLVALLAAAAVFLPYMILSEGYFTFFGDFNVQQIPFYKLCHKAVREGNVYWSFNTDLGANFIGSYTFYLLGSPFFWLTLPFPNSWVPYFMGPLLILKFALAALTAYFYIRRFTKTPQAASLGGILYAFSGFSVYNIFFNHFHEAIIVFPLLLLSLELLLTEKRRGVFAVCVALAAAVNYFFFFGMVVFSVIYFFVRVFSGCIKLKTSSFFALLFEAAVGFCSSAVIIIPSVLAILGNGRITDFLIGWSGIVYGKESIYPNILECFFFPPDLPARPVFFPEANVKWSSLGGWLPLYSMTGVFAFFKTRKNHWLKRVVGICIFMAMVPVLNSAFYAFNTSYYARWFYMPILLMCLMTAVMCEDSGANMSYGISWTLGITAATALVIGFFPQKKDGKIIFGLFTNPQQATYIARFASSCAIAILSLIILAMLLRLRRKSVKRFLNASLACVLIISILYANVFVATGRSHSYEIKEVMIDHLIEGEVDLPKSGDFRIDVYDGVDNTAMYLGFPSINAFHSVVPSSITDFYEFMDIERSVASRPGTEYPALRSLLSVKYLLADATLRKFSDSQGNTKMPGYKYLKSDGGYHIFENQNFVGYGFSYDYYMTREYAEDFTGELRSRLMLKAILLDKKQIKKYGDILENIESTGYRVFDDDDLSADAQALGASCADRFTPDRHGFSCTVARNKKSLVFFSVPYDKGWSATVDGKPVEIEKVNIGFMAVPVDAGTSVIRFAYKTPGLDAGICVSLISIIIFLIYFIVCGIYSNRHKTDVCYPEGEKLLNRWKTENIAETVGENLELNDLPGDISLLDKLDIDVNTIRKPPENTDGGFDINLNAFDDSDDR